MILQMNDAELLEYVQMAINSGAKEVTIPLNLLAGAREETIQEIRRLCQLCGVRIARVEAY